MYKQKLGLWRNHVQKTSNNYYIFYDKLYNNSLYLAQKNKLIHVH